MPRYRKLPDYVLFHRGSLSKSESAPAFARIGTADKGAGIRVKEDHVGAAEAFGIATHNLMAFARQFLFDVRRELRLEADLRGLDVIKPRR